MWKLTAQTYIYGGPRGYFLASISRTTSQSISQSSPYFLNPNRLLATSVTISWNVIFEKQSSPDTDLEHASCTETRVIISIQRFNHQTHHAPVPELWLRVQQYDSTPKRGQTGLHEMRQGVALHGTHCTTPQHPSTIPSATLSALPSAIAPQVS